MGSITRKLLDVSIPQMNNFNLLPTGITYAELNISGNNKGRGERGELLVRTVKRLVLFVEFLQLLLSGRYLEPEDTCQ